MLAIVIPYYKFTFFEETLQSLKNQTDKRFKVYIGDDASPENPTEVLEKYQGLFFFDYHRFDSNLGSTSLVKQWERCIALSKEEEWIMILGDDDYLEDNLVEEFYKSHSLFNGKANVIRIGSKIKNEKHNTLSDIYSHPIWERATDSFYRKFEFLTRSSLSEHIFSKSSYLEYGFHNYTLGWFSDDRAWIEFSEEKPIYSINDSVVYIRNSGLNISSRMDDLDAKNDVEITFYKFLILKKINFYNKQQRLKLIRKYEEVIKTRRNLSFKELFLLNYFYLKELEYYSFKKFIKRSIKSILGYE